MTIKHYGSILCLAFTILFLQAGCEHGTQSSGFSYGDSSVAETEDDETTDDSTSVNNFVGTWKLTASSGGTTWYAFFYTGGSWHISDNADGSSQRVYGSYSVSGSQLNGNMTNPGVGTGSISATISDGVMTLDFTEYWETPSKVTQYTGSKN